MQHEDYVTSLSPEDTRIIGVTLGIHSQPGDTFLLCGELGSGKTCLAQGIVYGLGGEDYARSPTFVLVAEHQGRIPIYHVDLYRLDHSTEVEQLGLEEYLLGKTSICIIEWADKAVNLKTSDHLLIQFVLVNDSTRQIKLSGCGERSAALVKAVKSERHKVQS